VSCAPLNKALGVNMRQHIARIEDIIAVLERYSQRATYGALGGVVGMPARSVMSGQAKTHRNSWIVALRSYKPTGYESSQLHPELEARREVITTAEELAAWLREHA
jgi:hypothetical protein